MEFDPHHDLVNELKEGSGVIYCLRSHTVKDRTRIKNPGLWIPGSAFFTLSPK